MATMFPISAVMPCYPSQPQNPITPRFVGEMWMKSLFLALLTQCLALQQNCTQVGRKAKNLTIQLQVSQSSEFDFSGYIPAVEVALSYINTNSCVLPDYHVSFTDVVDPQVSRKHCDALNTSFIL